LLLLYQITMSEAVRGRKGVAARGKDRRRAWGPRRVVAFLGVEAGHPREAKG
jgi:hypothetical protein